MKITIVYRITEGKLVEDYYDASKQCLERTKTIHTSEVEEKEDEDIFRRIATNNALAGMTSVCDSDGLDSFEFICAYNSDTKEDVTEYILNAQAYEDEL